MDQRQDNGAPATAGARYRLHLERYPERSGDSAFAWLARVVLRAMGLMLSVRRR